MPERSISRRRLSVLLLPLAAAVILGLGTAAGIVWLWREYTLYALALSAFAFLGGSLFLPRKESARIVVLGIGAGLLVGSLLAARGAYP